MKFNARKLNDKDYDCLVNWWKWWRWTPIPKNFLPDNGTGGIMIQKENIPIVAGFIYYTNSDAVVVVRSWIRIGSSSTRSRSSSKIISMSSTAVIVRL